MRAAAVLAGWFASAISRLADAIHRILMPPRRDVRRETFERVLADRSLLALGVLLTDPAGRERVSIGTRIVAFVFKSGDSLATAQDADYRPIPITRATARRLRRVFEELPVLQGADLKEDRHIWIRELGPRSATLAAAERAAGTDLASRARKRAEETFGGAQVRRGTKGLADQDTDRLEPPARKRRKEKKNA